MTQLADYIRVLVPSSRVTRRRPSIASSWRLVPVNIRNIHWILVALDLLNLKAVVIEPLFSEHLVIEVARALELIKFSAVGDHQATKEHLV